MNFQNTIQSTFDLNKIMSKDCLIISECEKSIFLGISYLGQLKTAYVGHMVPLQIKGKDLIFGLAETDQESGLFCLCKSRTCVS